MDTTTQPATPTTVPSRWPLVLAAALVVLPIVVYVLQFHFRYLRVPWYLPGLSTVAALCMAWAFLQRRSIGRLLGLLLVGLLAAAEWYFLLVLTALPAYTGPIAVGHPFPSFEVVRADGSVFVPESFHAPQKTVLVFFRGRW
jgi:hypothetical protein